MNIPMILENIRPGEEWTLNGDTLDGLTWLSDTAPPTAVEVEAAWPAVQAARQAEAAQAAQARADAIAHAKSLGFTDAMIAAMYPALVG